MKRTFSPLISTEKSLLSRGAVLLVSAVLLVPGLSQAAVVNLNHGNSSASVNLDSPAGMFNWSVDGQNQLNQQWFWYRIGAGLAAPINTISAANITYSDANTLIANYANSLFTLEITYILTGGGAGNADILESIFVHNSSANPLDFHLFQYSDFDLLGNPAGDTVSISGNPIDGFDYALQQKGLTQIAEAITSPAANRAEANLTPATLNSLNTIAGYDLNNSDFAGPGDATWALQWNATLGAGAANNPARDFWLFKDKLLSITPIPEPSALALVAMGLGAAGLLRRRSSR